MLSRFRIVQEGPHAELVPAKDGMVCYHSDVEKLQQQHNELHATVEAYKQAVFHFNRSHGDMSPLLQLVAAPASESLTKLKQVERANGVSMAIEHYVHHYDKAGQTVDEFLACFEERLTQTTPEVSKG